MQEKILCGLYIHIPFCVKKCNYCDFLSKNASDETKDKYVQALKNEISHKSKLYQDRLIKTIYIGGGTPSFLSQEHIVSILKEVYKVFNIDENAEITIEANPGTVTKEKLKAYKNCGINRISFGLQSANDKELKILGRIHTYEEFENNYYLAREEGFDNINIDLMSAIPSQTLDSYKESIRKVILLNPEHISSYSLIIEEGTYFYENRDKLVLPNEDEERKMYYMTNELLNKAGYYRYEISNYCKTGYESKHNSSYWTGIEYIGVGLGASSYIYKTRFRNIDNMNKYIEENESIEDKKTIDDFIWKEVQVLDKQEQMEEFMFLGLRMMKGISKVEFKKKFEKDIYEIYGKVINKYLNWDILTDKDDKIKLTSKGIDLSNMVLSEFIL